MSNEVQDVNALLGKGSEFEGKLTFEGTVRIDGVFSGEIFTDDTLIIGEGARVAAQIEAGTLIIYGDVQGDARATEVIELHSPARLRGNIETPNLVIDRGVLFEGSCRMDIQPAARAGAPAPTPGPKAASEPDPGRGPTPSRGGPSVN